MGSKEGFVEMLQEMLEHVCMLMREKGIADIGGQNN